MVWMLVLITRGPNVCILCFRIGGPSVHMDSCEADELLHWLNPDVHGAGTICRSGTFLEVPFPSSVGSVFALRSRTAICVTFGMAFLDCLLWLGVHNNDFITALPVTEGMTASGISAADVRQALACVPAVVCINLGFSVRYNSMSKAFPDHACQMNNVLFGNQLNRAFFTLGNLAAIFIFVPVIVDPVARFRGREAARRRYRRHRVQASCHDLLG